MNEKTECDLNSKLILESLACGDPYLRKNFIGASDAPIIMGVSPWRTPLQLYREKLGIEGPQTENAAMARGTQLEDEARRKFEEITGIPMLPKRIFHPEIEYMMASLDGIDPTGRYILEIKCPGSSHKTSLCGEIPAIYYPQLQHQMIVAGVDETFYFSYTRDSWQSLKCRRDEKYCKTLLQKEKEFWECLQEMREPDMMDRDYQQKSDLGWNILANELKSVQKKKKEILDREEQIKKELIKCCEDKNSIGSGIRVQKIVKKGSIMYDRIFELSNVNLDQYRCDSTEYWKISNVED